MIEKIKHALFFVMIAIWGGIRKKHIGSLYNTTAYPPKRTMKFTKARLVYILATCITLVAGLSTRVLAQYLPDFIAEHFGDALWAAMIYCGFRVIGVRKSLEWSLILSLIFCIAIELSQLYQAEWLNGIRRTVLGGLILGKGFLFIDLIRYTVGIILIYFIDRLWNRLKKQR